MPLLSKPAFGPRTAIAYITVGSLIDVWTAVWYFTSSRDDHGGNTWFWLAGLFLTGLTLVTIGILLGEIGRSARKAEMSPHEVQQQEVAIQETAAAHPQPVVAGGVGTPGMAAAQVLGTPLLGAMPAAVPAQPVSAPVPQQQYAPAGRR